MTKFLVKFVWEFNIYSRGFSYIYISWVKYYLSQSSPSKWTSHPNIFNFWLKAPINMGLSLKFSCSCYEFCIYQYSVSPHLQSGYPHPNIFNFRLIGLINMGFSFKLFCEYYWVLSYTSTSLSQSLPPKWTSPPQYFKLDYLWWHLFT